MAIQRLQPYTGPAILSYGFRPFFLLGAIYAGLSVLLWLPIFFGWLELQTAFYPTDWHIHEMLFGFLPAIITGFLLTAVPNWTGRLPVQGNRLGVLVFLWTLGRVAVLFSQTIGPLFAGLLDSLFLLAVTMATANEIIAGKNWRNLKVLIPLTVIFVANILFHLEAHFEGASDYSRRLGIAATIVLIMLIGGRIIPSFTRNWLVRERPGRLPVPFSRFDLYCLAVSVLGFAAWVLAPDALLTGFFMFLGGVLNLVRLLRWAGDRTVSEPLVLILHISYLFVPCGFVLTSLAVFLPDLVFPQAGIHAFGAGVVGTMTLAVMMRATLGHTGHALKMSPGAHFVFWSAVVAAILRVLASFTVGSSIYVISISGIAWSAAFLGFVIVFGGKLITPKWRPGD